MHKKQLVAVLDSMIASVVATANAEAEDNEPELTEQEARTLLSRKLKKAAKGLVAATVGCEEDEVVWVAVEPKTRKKAEKAAA